MKKYQQILSAILIVHIVIAVLTGIFSYGNGALAFRGEEIPLNKGWTMTSGDGTRPIEELPYSGGSRAGETVVISRQLPGEYLGKTLYFLSVEKELVVRMDGEELYSYGRREGKFSQSPGSVTHFIELPSSGEGNLEIEMRSDHPNYAATIGEMALADHNEAITRVLQKNMPEMTCSAMLMAAGVILLAFALIQRRAKRKAGGMKIMGIMMLWAASAYAAATGILHVWFGNPAFLFYLAYSFLLYMPVLLLVYYARTRQCMREMGYRILLGASLANILIQLALQTFRVADFYQMAWISLLLTACGAFLSMKKCKKTEAVLLFLLGAGSIGDVLLNYIGKAGDIAAVSRWTLLVYAVFMVVESADRIAMNRREEEIDKEQRLEQEVENKTGELREIQYQTEKMLTEMIEALSHAVDAKDRYTSGHSKRVAKYSRLLAERMGLDKEKVRQIYIAGLLHDVGKIRIPDEIINKAGKLTEEEFNYIKLHSIAGYHILKEISSVEGIAIGAKYHHERYDGKGYPNGLEGDNIPQIARIIGVADAYDAMASNRSYRKALPQYLVREEIIKGKGTQFDPVVADHMIALIDEDRDYQLKQTDSLQKTILIVDDEPVNVKIVECILQDEPMYTLLYCYDGNEALKILDEERIDLLLLDIEMPGMDGLAVMEEIRKRKIDVAVAFMSADRDFEMIEKAVSLDVTDYLTKPFMPMELKEIVHSLIEG